MSWEPINLRHVPDEPPEPPDYLELVYRGRRHWISGPPESLKTLVAYIILLAAVRMGERVALIDFEMRQRDARNRLREMGATDDDLDLIDIYEPDSAPPRRSSWASPTAARSSSSSPPRAHQMYGLDENRDAEKGAMTPAVVISLPVRSGCG